MPPIFSLAPSFGVVPQRDWVGAHGVHDSGYFADDNARWVHLIGSPQVAPKEGSCLRGAFFSETALHPTQLNVVELHGLVLDVDEFDGRPIDLQSAPAEITRRLGGHRNIGWTTFNSTPSAPRYRVILPLARPVSRRKYRHLWELINKELGYVVGEGQWNADRLGYLPRLPSEAARAGYRWWIWEGPLLDAELRFGELYETPDQVFLGEHAAHAAVVDTSNFVDEATALARARSYMRDAHLGVKRGSRHLKLFEKSCQLWWDFWLKPESVLTLLTEINARLEDPKSQSDVLKEVEAGFAWTRGPSARPQKAVAGGRRMRPPPVTYAGLEERAKRLKRKTGQQELGAAMLALSERAMYADCEHILDVTRSLARAIAQDYPKCEAKAAAKLFWPSMSITFAQDPAHWPSSRLGNSPEQAIDFVANLIAQVQHEQKAIDEHRADAEKRHLAARIFDATNGARNTPFTADEIASFAAQQRCTVDELKRRLIVQVGSAYHFFLGEEGYSPGITQNMSVYAAKALSLFEGDPAYGVFAYDVDEDGEKKLREDKELVDTYGIHAHGTVYSFFEQKSRYDHERRALLLPASPIRKGLRAERIYEVERYFDLIPAKEALLDWLAWLPRSDRAARLLYLVGPKDCGKSFLAECLSRIWSVNGSTKGQTVFHDFNAGMLKCLLVVCNEQLPVELRGRRGTERLRDEVVTLTRRLTQKHRDEAVVEGAMRFIITSNNTHTVDTDEALSKDDVDGLLDRLEVVQIPKAAGEYLRGLGWERTDMWLNSDLVARHVLWLHETRDLGECGRFGPRKREMSLDSLFAGGAPVVVDNSAHQVASAVRFGGATGKIFEWLYRDVVQYNSQHVRWGKNGTNVLHALVTPEDIQQQWEMVFGLSSRAPSRTELLAAIRAARETRARIVTGDRSTVHAISVDALEEWAIANDVDVENLAHKVKQATDKRLEHFTRLEDR